jgi:hypothetical protein
MNCSSHVASFTYFISADADPDAFFRIVSQLLFSNTTPFKVVMIRASDDALDIQVELRGVDASVADSIRRKLQRLSCVADVECIANDQCHLTSVDDQRL